jgi:Trm5-related predicted tRNA methylase
LIHTSKKEFIYLSPDADEEVNDVDPEKFIFVVGGWQVP